MCPNDDRNDVDTDITLESTDPPTFKGRVLKWSGERIPEPGERVLLVAEALPEEMTEEWIDDPNVGQFGIVTGYYQAHGYLGVKLRMDDGERLAAFGAEIQVDPLGPIGRGTVQ